MNLSVRQLKAFLLLAEERNFTRAAQRCHLTQPAFSAVIQSLEEALGVRLFDRSTRRVELTPEGWHFHRSAPRLLNDIEALVSEMREYVSKRRGRVAVAALPSLAAGWLPNIYAKFSAMYPGVRLTLHDALLEPCLAQVREGEVDMAIAALGRDMSGLEAEPLCEDRFYLICRYDHHLANCAAVDLAMLSEEGMIHLGRGSSIRQSLMARPDLTMLRTTLEVDHLATVTGLVLAGLGVSLVPGMTLFHFRHPGLRIIPLSAGSEIRRKLYLVRRANRSLSQAAAAFHALLMQERNSLGPGDQMDIRTMG